MEGIYVYKKGMYMRLARYMYTSLLCVLLLLPSTSFSGKPRLPSNNIDLNSRSQVI